METIQAVEVRPIGAHNINDGFDQMEEKHNINDGFNRMEEARPIGAHDINDGFDRMEEAHRMNKRYCCKSCDVDDCVSLWTILYIFSIIINILIFSFLIDFLFF